MFIVYHFCYILLVSSSSLSLYQPETLRKRNRSEHIEKNYGYYRIGVSGNSVVESDHIVPDLLDWIKSVW